MDLPDDAFSDKSISGIVAEAYELLISSGLSTEARNA
jgi:hypothetical protein